MSSLWGEEFVVKQEPVVAKKLINKIKEPKTPKVATVLTSKKLSLYEKVQMISENVKRILGKRIDDTEVITTYDQFVQYIDVCIQNGIVAVDTETNNSLDPITCKLMGLCLYTPGMKACYVPVNHTDMIGTKYDWQITEDQIGAQLQRLTDNNTKIIMHNGKFDVQVILCTCKARLFVYWDTMVGAQLLDENERAGLKQQYIKKIDPSIEKYDIEHLFEKQEYAIIPPEIFALYAATDSFMTFKLYLYQLPLFEQTGNERLYNLFKEVEMPMVWVTAEMELTGICIDTEYAEKLLNFYQMKLSKVEGKIEKELAKYSDTIAKWRMTPEAQEHPVKKKRDGTQGFGKSKDEQLQDPVSLTSPTQLAILLYDILKCPVVDKKSPRGTGEDIINKFDIPLCEMILEQRGLLKLIGTYIEKIPNCVNPATGKLHAKFHQLGAGTGRLSSSDPNLQNIPSHEKSIRMMFIPSNNEYETSVENSVLTLKKVEEVKTSNGWKFTKEIKVGDTLVEENGSAIVTDIKVDGDTFNFILL